MPRAATRSTPRRAPNFERGMSELAQLGARLSAEDIRLIQTADARGGLPAVQALLADVGLSADGFSALSTQYGRGGLGAVGQAVQAQAAHEQAAQVEHLAAETLGRLTPAQWVAVDRSLAADPSGRRLAEEAARLGLPAPVAARAAMHVAQHGVAATRQALSEAGREQARADALTKAAERELAAAKEGDPFASPEIAQAALNFVHGREADLVKAGLAPNQNEAPVAYLRRIAALPDAAAKLAQVSGGEAVAKVLVESTRSKESAAQAAELRRDLLARASARDEKHRAKHGESTLSDADKAQKASNESRRRVLEEAYNANQPPVIAKDASGQPVELPGTTERMTVTSTRKAALVRAHAEQSGENIVADVPTESGLSRHETLSQAYDTLFTPAQDEVDE